MMKLIVLRLAKVLLWVVIALTGVVALLLGVALLFYPPQYIYRVLVWQQSDALDWQKFPAHPLTPAPTPAALPVALDAELAPRFAQAAGVADWEQFLAQNYTQAFIVLQDGAVVYEHYFNGAQRDSMVTSFSVAKSFTSALIGIAIDEGYIHSVDDPITQYLPELAERDPRFQEITIRHLLLMASGLDYQEFRPLLLNGDDPLTSYYPDQRKLALQNTHIAEPPGLHFRYNKYHPQLLGMILERATGMGVTTYLQSRLWDRIGMEYAGSWSTDSTASDFEKMETGVNARAIDFAKFGLLFLHEGLWQGEPVISPAWVHESTQPYFPQNFSPNDAAYYPAPFAALAERPYYRFMWWGLARADGAYDYSAEGNKGQFIYVSPSSSLVIVRNGIEYGIPTSQWLAIFYEVASQSLKK